MIRDDAIKLKEKTKKEDLHMITVDYNLLKRQIRLLSRKLSSVELKPNEKALLDGLLDLLNSIEHEKPFAERKDK